MLALGALAFPAAGRAAPAAERATHRPHASARGAARPAPSAPFSRTQRAAFAGFAVDLAAREALPLEWILQQLGQARHVPAVQRLVMPPPTGQPKNWQAYRERFVEPRRIDAGLAFWRDNAAWLERAEAEYGVPPGIVVAIVGVETFYGRMVGSFRVLDALATLAFDFPKGRSDRSAFFRSELEAFLLWGHREGFAPARVRGSYAGAIGLPQFMPSSIGRYGIDFDDDGHVDLAASAPDTIGSIARYLASFGWRRGLAACYDAVPPEAPAERALLLAPDIVPSFSAAELTAHGAGLGPAGRAHDGLLALVALENGSAQASHFACSTNFYALTRYNWSGYYAMVVIALAEALVAAR